MRAGGERLPLATTREQSCGVPSVLGSPSASRRIRPGIRVSFRASRRPVDHPSAAAALGTPAGKVRRTRIPGVCT